MVKIKRMTRGQRRKTRVNSQIFGTGERPRISIYRSNRYIYAQIIDDGKRITLGAGSSSKKKETARQMGGKLADILKKLKIKKAVFDRGQYAYHGRLAAVADGLREGGVEI